MCGRLCMVWGKQQSYLANRKLGRKYLALQLPREYLGFDDWLLNVLCYDRDGSSYLYFLLLICIRFLKCYNRLYESKLGKVSRYIYLPRLTVATMINYYRKPLNILIVLCQFELNIILNNALVKGKPSLDFNPIEVVGSLWYYWSGQIWFKTPV